MLDETSSIITRTVIDLARELKIKLVAEGIENQEQLTYLRSLNCYSGQGYLYNKPMPVEEFAQILLREKCIPAEQPGENKKREEKRKYLRINLAEVLEADAAILGTPGQKFKIGKIKVKIKNISSRGLCLTAGVRLPVNKDFVMQFRISLPGYKETRICGYPVWVEELDENFYEYGVEFDYRAEEAENIAGVIYALGKYMNGIQ